MLDTEDFVSALGEIGIEFFAGVPDSTLKELCACISDSVGRTRHIIAANEGNAIGLAAGYYLATGKPGLAYMQNSGLGNAVNPLTSLTDPLVYGIPVLLIIGWRGEPGRKDEPQHAKQGRITLSLLDTLGIGYEILPDSMERAKETLIRARTELGKNNVFALVVRTDTFVSYSVKQAVIDAAFLGREAAIIAVCRKLGRDSIIVSTTGKISRELYEYRQNEKMDNVADFFTVGSMGHCSQIALGIALAGPDRNIYCFDGDGAAIMHMGGLSTIGTLKPQNFKHIIFNNGAHESVGGQPTAGFDIDFVSIAQACGYAVARRVRTEKELEETLPRFIDDNGPSLLEIIVTKKSRKDLGRPRNTPIETKENFMRSFERLGCN
jgi:phosphonopyruvate decarboxylase